MKLIALISHSSDTRSEDLKVIRAFCIKHNHRLSGVVEAFSADCLDWTTDIVLNTVEGLITTGGTISPEAIRRLLAGGKTVIFVGSPVQ